jgi:hypothetical protein
MATLNPQLTMIFIPFGRNTTRQAGGRGVAYLIDDLRPNPVEVLRGLPQETIGIINTLTFADKYTSFVLSFSELLERSKIDEIIDSHEELAFEGIDSTDISRFWVLHEDHGRTELHCIIANVHLSTGKSWKHYFHKADKKLFKAWQELTNIKYGLSSPDEPERARIESKPTQGLNKKETEIHAEMDQKVCDALLGGTIQNQSDIVNLLREEGYEATGTKKYVGFRPKGSKERKTRLSGFKYVKDFDASRDLASYFWDREMAQWNREREQTFKETLEIGKMLRRKRNSDRYKPKNNNSKGDSYGNEHRTDSQTPVGTNRASSQSLGGGKRKSSRDHTKTLEGGFGGILRSVTSTIRKLKRAVLHHIVLKEQKKMVSASELSVGRQRRDRWNRLIELRIKHRSHTSPSHLSAKTRDVNERHQQHDARRNPDNTPPSR